MRYRHPRSCSSLPLSGSLNPRLCNNVLSLLLVTLTPCGPESPVIPRSLGIVTNRVPRASKVRTLTTDTEVSTRTQAALRASVVRSFRLPISRGTPGVATPQGATVEGRARDAFVSVPHLSAMCQAVPRRLPKRASVASLSRRTDASWARCAW